MSRRKLDTTSQAAALADIVARIDANSGAPTFTSDEHDALAALVKTETTAPTPAEFAAFFDAFLKCMIWAERPDGDDADPQWPEDNDTGRDQLAPETLDRLAAECKTFCYRMGPYIDACYAMGAPGYHQAGHDFWLTRNGHGAGFWDGDWPKEYEQMLTRCAQMFGELHPYRGDDGRLYVA